MRCDNSNFCFSFILVESNRMNSFVYGKVIGKAVFTTINEIVEDLKIGWFYSNQPTCRMEIVQSYYYLNTKRFSVFFFFSNSLLVVVLKNGRKICCFVWCVVALLKSELFFSSFWWWLSLALYCYFCSVFSLLFQHFHSIIASIVRLTVDIGWNAWCFNKHRRQQQKTKQKSEQK